MRNRVGIEYDRNTLNSNTKNEKKINKNKLYYPSIQIHQNAINAVEKCLDEIINYLSTQIN